MCPILEVKVPVYKLRPMCPLLEVKVPVHNLQTMCPLLTVKAPVLTLTTVPTTGSQGISSQPPINVPNTVSRGTSPQPPINVPTTDSQGTSGQTPTNVPTRSYPKLSRLEDHHLFPEELAMVRETRFIFSLDLVLKRFLRNVSILTVHMLLQQSTTLLVPLVLWTGLVPLGTRGNLLHQRTWRKCLPPICKWQQVFSFLETILPKFRRWPIFLVYVLLWIPSSTECKGSIPSINEWQSWQREQLIHEIMERNITVVVMVIVSPQGTLPRICVTFSFATC